MTTRVLVVEDHPLFRDGLASLLSSTSGVSVVATCANVEELMRLARELVPDVVVLDLGLEDGSSIGAIPTLVGLGCRVLVLTAADDDATVYAALRAGANGYLLKNAAPDAVVRGVLALASGEGLFDATVVERITSHLASGGRASRSSVLPQLSPRECEVLTLMAQGRSNADIADHFVLSLKTVRNHVSNVLTKLGVASRAEAIVVAREAGLADRS